MQATFKLELSFSGKVQKRAINSWVKFMSIFISKMIFQVCWSLLWSKIAFVHFAVETKTNHLLFFCFDWRESLLKRASSKLERDLFAEMPALHLNRLLNPNECRKCVILNASGNFVPCKSEPRFSHNQLEINCSVSTLRTIGPASSNVDVGFSQKNNACKLFLLF